MAAMVERTCRCGTKFMARKADVKRGWGKSCGKSCAAKKREYELDRNGYHSTPKANPRPTDDDFSVDYEGGGWDAHKDVF